MKKILLVSSLIPKNISDELSALGFESLKIGKSDKLRGEIAYHPDILMLKLPNGIWLSDNYEQIVNVNVLRENGLEPKYINLKKQLTDGYPQECALNCFFASDKLFCGVAAADELISFSESSGYERVVCKQGYLKCSTAKISDKAFITNDSGICKALIANGFDAIVVRTDGIKLKGYDCGFIGGSSALLEKNFIAFTGKIEAHRDYDKIKSFCLNHGVAPYSLSNEALYDYGGLLEA